ncbi:tetratricopeptide repeat protein [Marinobacter nauticus]|uniref:tetratricopeptide repeat protein n=1 Tax=Marinobacter nauticus TaxID=2743 RepID=UPI001CD37EC2|nr:tetratricopeptide repeat protein [Marinobacter nauticus]MCA0914605.1 tetratricopeptide repeat protein [Marinobacter nauticus]
MEALLKDLMFDIFLLTCLVSVVGGLLLVLVGMRAYSVYISHFSGDSLLSNQFQRSALKLSNEDKTSELKNLSQARVTSCPGDSLGHYYLALAYYREKSYLEAMEHYHQVAQLQPTMKGVADQSIEEINQILSDQESSIV